MIQKYCLLLFNLVNYAWELNMACGNSFREYSVRKTHLQYSCCILQINPSGFFTIYKNWYIIFCLMLTKFFCLCYFLFNLKKWILGSISVLYRAYRLKYSGLVNLVQDDISFWNPLETSKYFQISCMTLTFLVGLLP